jgi:hypothetical protein
VGLVKTSVVGGGGGGGGVGPVLNGGSITTE